MTELYRVDYDALISRSDLIYRHPANSPVEGQPIGNGRMGTMVWTDPGAVNFQINRSDVFAVNKDHVGAREDSADVWGGCARITIDVGDYPFRDRRDFSQHLSLYRAECTVKGHDMIVRCIAHAVSELLLLEVEDRRDNPQPIRVSVSMWRSPVCKTGAHTARYSFETRESTVFLVEEFTERDYFCRAAAAVKVCGEGVKIEDSGDAERVIVIPPGTGKKLVLVSTASSWNPGSNLCEIVEKELEKASGSTYDEMASQHFRWWEGFWSRTFVHLTSDDAVADFMENVRTLQLYYMASTSRGALPAKWNGSLFLVGDDQRMWGSQFWVWTTEISYYPVHAADAGELADPFFDMYVKQLPSAEKAAEQRWDAKGAFFLESGPFDGPVVLPQKIAREFQDVYLGRKPNWELSAEARALGLFECGLSQIADDRKPPHIDAGRYSYASHIASSGSEVAVHAWWRYRYTGDKSWLERVAYPLLKATVEFYRHLARRGDDGRYHLFELNQHEAYWGVNDGITDLAAIRGTAPLAIRSAEILELDLDLREKWRDLLDNLADYPMGGDPDSVGRLADDVWSIGHRGASEHVQKDPGEGLMWPIFPFEDWTLETRDPETDRIAMKFADLNTFRINMLTEKPWGDAIYGSATRTPILGSRTGRGEELPLILASYYCNMSQGSTRRKPLPNGFSQFEGITAHSIEHLGSISMAVNEGLLQSLSPRPGEPEIISVFTAWPKKWKAAFRLLARGGFLVSSYIQDGKVDLVELESRSGEACRLRNPWDSACTVRGSDGSSVTANSEVLCFATKAGTRYRVLPDDAGEPDTHLVPYNQTSNPATYSMKLPRGAVVEGILGIPS